MFIGGHWHSFGFVVELNIKWGFVLTTWKSIYLIFLLYILQQSRAVCDGCDLFVSIKLHIFKIWLWKIVIFFFVEICMQARIFAKRKNYPKHVMANNFNKQFNITYQPLNLIPYYLSQWKFRKHANFGWIFYKIQQIQYHKFMAS